MCYQGKKRKSHNKSLVYILTPIIKLALTVYFLNILYVMMWGIKLIMTDSNMFFLVVCFETTLVNKCG